ncbi:unnamed protein product [Lota lota]
MASSRKYRGLKNQGSTCYLNSMLQVLFMTPEFRHGLISNCEMSLIDAQLKNLFHELKTSSPTTEYISHKLGIENVWEQRDAAEYFERILSLASPRASQIFLGGLTHRTTCSQCGQSTEEHGSFWTLNLAINNASIGVYKVEDGLKEFFSQSKLTGDNQLYCDQCKAKADATTESKLGTHPTVLVLLLKRFEFSYNIMDYVKNDSPVDVPLNIELPKGMSYELYATVDHYGNLSGGHYSASISPLDDGGKWHNFNDSAVTLINNFNPQKSQNVYLLFYRRKRLNASPQEVNYGSSVDPAEVDTDQLNGTTVTTVDNGNADGDSDGDVNVHSSLSSSVPMDEQQVWAGRDEVTGGDDVMKRGEVTGGDDVMECGEVTGGDYVTGDTHPMESGRLERKGGERMKTDVEVPTNETKSCEPGDHAVQQEASRTAPKVSDAESFVNERNNDRSGSTGLLVVHLEEEEMKGGVLKEKKRRTVGTIKDRQFIGIDAVSQRQGCPNSEENNKDDVIKEKKPNKRKRKVSFCGCITKQTSDTE